VLAQVAHRQWVFTIPKRLRVYFRYDRSLLGGLCQAAYETVCDTFTQELDGRSGVPAMVGAVQTFGDLVHWHPHIHGIVPEGVFDDDGEFLAVPDIWKHRAVEFWQERVLCLLLKTLKIDEQTAASMRAWRHSGFSVDTSVRIEAGDTAGMERLIGYIARCPFSLARMIRRTPDGKVLYRASHPQCQRFPRSGDQTLMAGISRNFEVYDPLDFLAEVTQHIPNKGEHQIRYYGWYSNKCRGMRLKASEPLVPVPAPQAADTPLMRARRLTWAALIKKVYEVDPLKCPACGGTMKVISFIENSRQPDVVEKILKHCGLWRDQPQRAPPAEPGPGAEPPPRQLTYDYAFFQQHCA